MPADVFVTDFFDILDGFAQPNDARNIWRARFKLMRQFVVGRFFEGDRLDHFATAVVGRHLVQPLFLAVQHAYTRRAEHFMPGEGVEVGIQFLHIHLGMRNGLRAIHEYRNTFLVRLLDDGFDWIDRTQRIRNVAEGKYLYLIVHEGIQFVQHQLPFVVHGGYAEFGTALFADHLPGHDIAVVLHGGDKHGIPFVDEFAAVRGRHQVDAFRATAHKNTFLAGTGIDELAHELPGFFKSRGCFLAELVDTAVHIGVTMAVIVVQLIDYSAGFLARSRAVQENDGLAIHFLFQQRKVLPDFIDIEHFLGDCLHSSNYCSNFWLISISAYSRTLSCGK